MSEAPEPAQIDSAEILSPLGDPPILPYESVHETGKPWRVGTLAYTTGGLVILFCWLLWGDFAWSMKDRSVSPVVQLLIRQFHASDTLAAVMLVSLPQVISVILSPIISYKSDRHRGRWGRRIPFLLLPTPFAVLSMVGLAFSPLLGRHLHAATGEHSLGLDRSTLIFFGLFWTTFEVATIIANSVYGAFVNDVVPRPLLGRFYGLFRAFSLIAGMVFNHWMFGSAGQHYVPIFIGIGLLYGVGFSIMCFKVKEGQYPPPPPPPKPASVPTPLLAMKEYCRDCFTKPYYYWVFAAIILPGLAFMPINTFNLYFSESVGMTGKRYGDLMAFYFLLSLIQTIPIGWLADKFHPTRVAMVALVLHGTAALWGGAFAHDARTFGIAYVATGTLSGTWYTATAAMGAVLLPKMKFAQYASALGVIQALLTMCLSPMMGRALDLTHHQYHYTYLVGGAFDILGLIATFVVFRKVLSLGGIKNYVAP